VQGDPCADEGGMGINLEKITEQLAVYVINIFGIKAVGILKFQEVFEQVFGFVALPALS
jgi:hypothetical protein